MHFRMARRRTFSLGIVLVSAYSFGPANLCTVLLSVEDQVVLFICRFELLTIASTLSKTKLETQKEMIWL